VAFQTEIDRKREKVEGTNKTQINGARVKQEKGV